MKPRQETHRYSALFLDRDGVINRRNPEGYISYKDEFALNEGVGEAMAELSFLFNWIIVVTNQQGVGKGLMTEGDLMAIHDKMIEEIETAGGRIDKIYSCTSLEEAGDIRRKPSAGMILQAQEDFPQIDLSESWMVGDTISDLELAKNMGIKSAFIWSDLEANSGWESYPVYVAVPDLLAFVSWLKSR